MASVTVPENGIGYELNCGCVAVHMPGTMTRTLRIGDARPCATHRRVAKIEAAWSNL